jgi:hypothetical protein
VLLVARIAERLEPLGEAAQVPNEATMELVKLTVFLAQEVGPSHPDTSW